MTQYGFYFDSTRCTGCRTCEMACKDYNDLPASYAFRRVFDYEGGDWKDNGDGTFEHRLRYLREELPLRGARGGYRDHEVHEV